jgi:hypothetical protein
MHLWDKDVFVLKFMENNGGKHHVFSFEFTQQFKYKQRRIENRIDVSRLAINHLYKLINNPILWRLFRHNKHRMIWLKTI